jgi:nucleotide-binding universal stress UspA family protein
MKVILSADIGDAGDAALQWCRTHLGPGDEVIAVFAMSGLGEFVLGVPPVDALGGDKEVQAEMERTACGPLRDVGVTCESRVVVTSATQALSEMAPAEDADLIVIGKRSHWALVDAVLHDTATQLLHHPPCPIVVVPAGAHLAS